MAWQICISNRSLAAIVRDIRVRLEADDLMEKPKRKKKVPEFRVLSMGMGRIDIETSLPD